MAESSIAVAVRIRPFSAKEAAQLAPQETYSPFLGDGGLSARTSIGGTSTTNAPSLRTKFLRPIISPVDDKVLIFDPPETNLLSASTHSAQNTFAFGRKKAKDVRYAFDRVFDEKCGQRDVFENTTKPLLDGILNGYNASVFAYGATGCGKTHTISGTPEDPGVIFLTMKELYERIKLSREDSEVQVRLSYLEIYNESIRDLLSPTPTPPGQGLMLREDASRKISVVGITEHVPESPERVLEMIQEGNLRRTMSPTEANAVSSRSHAVLQINVTQQPRTASTITETTSASLNIIDLAGSERASATRNNGVRMKEGANINKSLLALGNCINALCQSGGQRLKHVPYRNSKLTRLLKFSLGGNCKTVMIVCVSPSSAHYDETHNTLKYANQAKNIRTKVSRNMLNVDRHVAQYVQAIHELREEVSELKARLVEKSSIDTIATKKRKAEVLKEVQDVKIKLRTSTDSTLQLIKSHAGVEAQMEAAAARLTAYQQTLISIDSQLHNAEGKDTERFLMMKDIYKRLEAKEDAILQDPSRISAFRSLSNSIEMHRNDILAACRNIQFDEEAADSIRVYGDSLIAEVNAVRNEINYDGTKTMLGLQGSQLDLLVESNIQSSLVLKQLAIHIDNSVEAGIEVDAPIMAALPGVKEAQVKSEKVLKSIHEEKSFSLKSSTQTGSNQISFILKQAQTINRRPITVFAGRSVAGTSNKALYPMSSPRKIKLRRSSVGAKRRHMPASIVVNPAANKSVSQDNNSAPKKSFRWADEAGEGKLDNHNRSISFTIPSDGLSSSSAAEYNVQSDPDSSLLQGNVSEQSSKTEENPMIERQAPVMRPTKREGGSIFERNFLSKKEAKRDVSLPHEGVIKDANRAPFSDLSNEAGDASIGSSDDSSIHATLDVNATAVAQSSPYQRKSSHLGSIHSKKARSSLSSEVSGPIRRSNSGTLHRVAIGPPSFTASRSSRSSNISSNQIRNGTVQSSPAPSSHHTLFRPNSSIGNSSGTAWR